MVRDTSVEWHDAAPGQKREDGVAYDVAHQQIQERDLAL